MLQGGLSPEPIHPKRPGGQEQGFPVSRREWGIWRLFQGDQPAPLRGVEHIVKGGQNVFCFLLAVHDLHHQGQVLSQPQHLGRVHAARVAETFDAPRHGGPRQPGGLGG